MRYIAFYMMAILVLEKLRVDKIVIIKNKRQLNRDIKKYYNDNKEAMRQLR